MSFIWDYFMAHWLAVWWIFIGGIILCGALTLAKDEILFRIERRRHQRAR